MCVRTTTMLNYLTTNITDPTLRWNDRKFIVNMYSLLECNPDIEMSPKQTKWLADLTMCVSGQKNRKLKNKHKEALN